ncbi:MAG: S24/S26 family peptidase [Oscillospiraceae bacterium]|nr:S24/S26 family peptidase [Oscillospiraceae bacterium]
MKSEYSSPTLRTVPISVEKWIGISAELIKDECSLPVQFKVNGVSMLPFIRSNRDTVTVIPLFREPRVGDVVLFRAKRLGGDYVLHRVYQVDGGKIRTLGDGCLTPDEWLSRDAFVGIAVSIQRGKKKIDCTSKKWKTISAFWLKLLPIRKFLLRFASIRIFNKVGCGA